MKTRQPIIVEKRVSVNLTGAEVIKAVSNYVRECEDSYRISVPDDPEKIHVHAIADAQGLDQLTIEWNE